MFQEINSRNRCKCNDDCYNLVLLFRSLHGIVRGENMELGRDSDTGGQVLHILTHLNHKLEQLLKHYANRKRVSIQHIR